MTTKSFNPFLILTLLAVVVTVFSCNRKAPAGNGNAEELVNQEIVNHEGETILVGKTTRDAFDKEPYREWFQPGYDDYEVDKATLDGIKSKMEDVDLMVFMGSWCEDSQYYIPQFFKIIDYLGYDTQKLTLVNVDNHPDRYKQSPQHEEEGLNIESVPTFILRRNGMEIGRIVEFPEETLEKDMARILEN